MTKTTAIKALGLVGALLTSLASFLTGDYVTGIGVTSAALSSATLFSEN